MHRFEKKLESWKNVNGDLLSNGRNCICPYFLRIVMEGGGLRGYELRKPHRSTLRIKFLGIILGINLLTVGIGIQFDDTVSQNVCFIGLMQFISQSVKDLLLKEFCKLQRSAVNRSRARKYDAYVMSQNNCFYVFCASMRTRLSDVILREERRLLERIK